MEINAVKTLAGLLGIGLSDERAAPIGAELSRIAQRLAQSDLRPRFDDDPAAFQQAPPR